MKTFKGSKCTLRNVQTKEAIPAHRIDQEVSAIVSVFGKALGLASGITMEWHKLDLSNVECREKQVGLVKGWGRVGVKLG
jgi:hypothetical protein